MPAALPLLLTAAAALIGAGLMAFWFRQSLLPVAAGAAAGALAGGAGSLLFMLPLDYCTFSPESQPIDVALGLGLVAVGMLLLLLPVYWLAGRLRGGWRTLLASDAPPGSFKGWLWPLLLLLPTLAILFLFLYYPALDTLRLATQTSLLGIRGTIFVCVDNFTRLATDRSYLQALGNTALITVMTVGISMALSLLIALAAFQPVKGARLYRTLLIWPYAISPVVAGVIFLLLFNPTGGIINYFLGVVGIEGIRWLNSPTYAPWAVIAASVWKSMGFNILFYIAGLQNVPNDLKEAAAIDGANVFQRFRYIVLPLLSPITFFLLITNTTYAVFETFGTIDYLTPGGGPLQSTETLMYRVYRVGIQNNDLGNGAAQSIILFLLVIALTVFQFRSSGSRVNYGA
ncbi:MAG: sugar ABC transporter permease [Anaerolineae bacterium]|jgi:sn-glycerol 3-phosphate transport system permease protein|nr:sugar ABC transporter permease [Anaerolineae bacterium]